MDRILMENLDQEILQMLKTQPFCLVPDERLLRVWPNGVDRRQAMNRFATQRSWRLYAYVQGEGAIFVPQSDRQG